MIDEQRLGRAMGALNSELAASNRVVASRLGLNDSDLAVLDVLHREGPQTPTALARRTRMGVTTMTSVLRRLAAAGWVERRPNQSDLRSFTIHPTSVERLTELFRPAHARFAALVAGWSPDEAGRLVEFLERAAQVIHEQTDQLAGAAPGEPGTAVSAG